MGTCSGQEVSKAILPTLIATVLVGAALLFGSIDGPTGIVCLFSRTEYAAGYQDSNFRRIHVGMSEAQVRDLLGPPLRLVEGETPGSPLLSYARRQEARACYRERDISIESGNVTTIVAECTCD